MKIGFIGAGKMGFTLGKYLSMNEGNPNLKVDYSVVGYYSRSIESAKEAAEFTDTNYYDSIEGLVEECDTLFVTVPDNQIAVIAEKLSRLGDLLEGKIVCHTSGALSSQVFSGIGNHIYGYSIHPIYAVSSKTESYINFNESFITIEGHEKYIGDFVSLFEQLGHKVSTIGKEDKAKYHSAAVFASNLTIGLFDMACSILVDCGFTKEKAQLALKPLFKNNANNIVNADNLRSVLTGPMERCDSKTIGEHLEVLDGDWLDIYKGLSRQLLTIVENDADKDYGVIRKMIAD